MDLVIPGPAGSLAVRVKESPSPDHGWVILVHGATYCGQSAFDFQAPAPHRASLMDWLTAEGFSTVTFAIRGYGASEPVTDGLSVSTDAAVADLTAVADWLAGAHGASRPHLFGWSWGGRTAGLYTARNPGRVNRQVLFAGALSPRTVVQVAPAESHRENTVQSVLDRIEPDLTDAVIRRAYAEFAAAQEPRSPNGVFYDLATGGKPPEPEAITRPTLLVYGAADRIYDSEHISGFFHRLSTDDKMLAVVPRSGHFMQIQHTRHRLYALTSMFLSA